MARFHPQKTGELLWAQGLVSLDDIDRALEVQKRHGNRLFGAVLCDLNRITPLENYRVLRSHDKLLDLDQALIRQGLLSRGRLEAVKDQIERSGIPFISGLLQGGLVPRKTLKTLLYDLFRIPLRSIRDIRFSKDTRPHLAQIIPEPEAKQHQAAPLILKQKTLVCGVTDPDALLYIRSLDQRFPQHRFKTVFLSFPEFEGVCERLYTTETAGQDPRPQVDLSLLLSYKAVIADPKKEISAVFSLFRRYEKVRDLMGKRVKEGTATLGKRSAGMERQTAFLRFIREQHEKITSARQCPALEFTLDRQGERLVILAAPRFHQLRNPRNQGEQ